MGIHIINIGAFLNHRCGCACAFTLSYMLSSTIQIENHISKNMESSNNSNSNKNIIDNNKAEGMWLTVNQTKQRPINTQSHINGRWVHNDIFRDRFTKNIEWKFTYFTLWVVYEKH